MTEQERENLKVGQCVCIKESQYGLTAGRTYKIVGKREPDSIIIDAGGRTVSFGMYHEEWDVVYPDVSSYNKRCQKLCK